MTSDFGTRGARVSPSTQGDNGVSGHTAAGELGHLAREWEEEGQRFTGGLAQEEPSWASAQGKE